MEARTQLALPKSKLKASKMARPAYAKFCSPSVSSLQIKSKHSIQLHLFSTMYWF